MPTGAIDIHISLIAKGNVQSLNNWPKAEQSNKKTLKVTS
jgi:hypothetical protein